MVLSNKRTYDYRQFTFLDENRTLNKSHVAKLTQIFENKPHMAEFRPILVNEKMEIIDGQHRFSAWKALGLPIYYSVGQGLSIREAQELNAGQQNWKPLDYALSYAKSGDQNYQTYLDFKEEFKLPHNTTLAYLTDDIDVSGMASTFREGNFKVRDRDEAWEKAYLLLSTGDIVPEQYKRKGFTLAFLLLAKHPDYDHQAFLSRLKSRGHTLAKYEVLSDYLRALERIYNYRQMKKIRLF